MYDTEDDSRLFQDSVARYLAKDYGFAQRTQALAAWDAAPAHWQAFAELGWLAVGMPEDLGGYGGAHEQLALAEQLGGALVVEPWLANAALCAPALLALDAPGQAHRLGALMEGRLRLALAAWEPQGRYDAFEVRTTARQDAQGHWCLDGTKTLVLGGGQADVLLVLARVHGEPRSQAGLSLFAVPADTSGVTVRALPTYDGRTTASVGLAAVRVPADAAIGAAGQAWPAIERAIDQATVMLCGEAVGAMAQALSLTQSYLSDRRQFGRAITDNQVVRHRLVDMFVAIEQSRAITEAAAARLDDTPAARRRAVSLAKAFVSPAARRVGEDAVQLHGAIGMTDEYRVGHCYKRLAAAANLLGDTAWHLERLAAQH